MTWKRAWRPATTLAVAARNLCLGSNLAAAQLLRRPSLLLSYACESLFLYNSMAGGRRLPVKGVGEVFGNSDPIPVLLMPCESREGDGWFGAIPSYTADILALCMICQITKPKEVFEIGTLRGYTAYHMALNTGPDSRIYSLDLPKDAQLSLHLEATIVDEWHVQASRQTSSHCFTNTPVADKISLLEGDSATYDFSRFRDRIDLFFIDGSHSFDYVMSDTLRAVGCCKKGGVIAWHDYGREGVNGVSKWLHEYSKTLPIYSIPGGSLAYAVL